MAPRDLTLRLARVSDVTQLSDVYFECVADSPGDILKSLGRAFRRAYYRLMLLERNSLVLCAESSHRRILGFACGTLDAAEHISALKRHRMRLLGAALPALIRNPRLVAELRNRESADQEGDADNGYVVASGPRLEFWGVVSEARTGGTALTLLQAWLSMARLLGAVSVRFEVNRTEWQVESIHRRLGAEVVKEFVTRAGVARKILQYSSK